MKFAHRADLIDAGLSWVGPIPRQWTVRRLGHYFEERRQKVSDKDFAPLSVTMRGVVPQLETVAKTDDGDNRKLVRCGDFVINSRSDRKGAGGVAPRDGSVSLINTVLAQRSGIRVQFANYLLTSYPFQEEFYRVGNGIVADMWTTKYSEMKAIRLAVPGEAEQDAIVAHLDRETSRIDTLVAKKTRFIELLREKRQALITHALTKGLDPNAPMKDSGIEWFGGIPSNWKVAPFRLAAWFQEGPGIMASDFKESGVPLLRVSGVQREFATTAGCNYLDPEKVAKRWKHFMTELGDLLISASATTGTISEVGEDTAGCIPYTGIIRLKASGMASKEFLKAFLGSRPFIEQINHFKTGSTIQHFGPTHLSQMRIALPPPEVQELIVAHLGRATARIDKLIAKTERSIRLLGEHRTALITAAVTGKIDLRASA